MALQSVVLAALWPAAVGLVCSAEPRLCPAQPVSLVGVLPLLVWLVVLQAVPPLVSLLLLLRVCLPRRPLAGS